MGWENRKYKYYVLRLKKLCVYCTKKAITNAAYCERCKAKLAEANKKRRTTLKAKGICQDCRKEKRYGELVRCKACNEKLVAYYWRTQWKRL